jgi:hypothetical protein
MQYQRFHLGFVWTHAFGPSAEFCPDVRLTPYSDGIVDMGDVLWIVSLIGGGDVRADVYGDGYVDIGDALLAMTEIGSYCWPT